MSRIPALGQMLGDDPVNHIAVSSDSNKTKALKAGILSHMKKGLAPYHQPTSWVHKSTQEAGNARNIDYQ